MPCSLYLGVSPAGSCLRDSLPRLGSIPLSGEMEKRRRAEVEPYRQEEHHFCGNLGRGAEATQLSLAAPSFPPTHLMQRDLLLNRQV